MTANTVCISVLVVLVLSVCGAAQADEFSESLRRWGLAIWTFSFIARNLLLSENTSSASSWEILWECVWPSQMWQRQHTCILSCAHFVRLMRSNLFDPWHAFIARSAAFGEYFLEPQSGQWGLVAVSFLCDHVKLVSGQCRAALAPRYLCTLPYKAVGAWDAFASTFLVRMQHPAHTSLVRAYLYSPKYAWVPSSEALLS